MTTTSSQSIRPQFRTIDGLAIRYAESEPRPDDALLLNPWPESLYAYEPSWSRLAAQAHLVAIDMPGFGHSERRESLMSPRAMSEFVVRVADAFGLERPHLVGMDVGCDAALFAAAYHPARFRSLVVGSGGAAFPLQLGGRLKEWVEAPDLEAYRAVDGHEIIAGTLKQFERYTPTQAAREDYISSYAGERFVESMPYVRSYRRISRCCATCCRRSRRRCRSSPARETMSCHRSTRSTSRSGCPTASSTSSTRATLPGRTGPTSTRRWSRAGGPEATEPPE